MNRDSVTSIYTDKELPIIKNVIDDAIYSKNLEAMVRTILITDYMRAIMFSHGEEEGTVDVRIRYDYNKTFNTLNWRDEISTDAACALDAMNLYGSKVIASIVSRVGAILGDHYVKLHPRIADFLPTAIADLVSDYEGGVIDAMLKIDPGECILNIYNIKLLNQVNLNTPIIARHRVDIPYDDKPLSTDGMQMIKKELFTLGRLKTHAMTTTMRYYRRKHWLSYDGEERKICNEEIRKTIDTATVDMDYFRKTYLRWHKWSSCRVYGSFSKESYIRMLVINSSTHGEHWMYLEWETREIDMVAKANQFMMSRYIKPLNDLGEKLAHNYRYISIHVD